MIKLRLRSFLFVIVLGLVITLFIPISANALSGSEFQAGRIMDDGVFFNSGSMNVQQIQEFLNAKVPSCDTNGQISIYDSTYGDTVTRKIYSERRGISTPFTCLKDLRQDTVAKSAETNLCNGYSVANQSAAEIIYGVSQSCGVSSKVLVVLLQKEQSLVTDDWPWPIQYRSATGYGCPDTAPCDAQYYGFFNQVYSAARQFKRYARDSNLFNFRANTTSYVQYSPNASCGGSNIYIQNQATAGLYNYTPYQPNSAALNNLYGTGDGCSAYGNRNFWRLYNDWFGATKGVDYSWQYAGISFSTGSSHVIGNTQVTVTVTAKNTGNQAWSSTNFPVRLATFAPTNHSSALYNSSWVSDTRLATVGQSVVLPGENGTFTFTINVPNREGPYTERFNLVAEGAKWMPDPDFSINLTITKSTYKWQMVSQSSSQGFALSPGSGSQFTLVAKNMGNTTWSNSINPVRLATFIPTNRNSAFYHSSWVSSNRPAVLQEPSVGPGQNGTFVFNVTAPSTPGFYVERFNLVSEGLSWFEDPWFEFDINVGNFYTWRMDSQTSSTGTFTLARNSTSTFTLTATNTGNVTWNNSSNPVRLATWAPSYRTSIFNPNDASWVSQFRAATLTQASVSPGSNGTFVFTVKAPSAPGFYVERFNLVMEGVSWLQDPWMEFDITVN